MTWTLVGIFLLGWLWGFTGSWEIHLCGNCGRRPVWNRLFDGMFGWVPHLLYRVFVAEPRMRKEWEDTKRIREWRQRMETQGKEDPNGIK